MAGTIRIESDLDIAGYRIVFTADGDDDTMLMNQPLVAEDVVVASERKSSPWSVVESSLRDFPFRTAEWTGCDFSTDVGERKAFRVLFNNAKYRDEFVEHFRTVRI